MLNSLDHFLAFLEGTVTSQHSTSISLVSIATSSAITFALVGIQPLSANDQYNAMLSSLAISAS